MMENLEKMKHFAPEPVKIDPVARDDRRYIWILFFAALLLRFVFAFDGLFNDETGDRFLRPDSESYMAPAGSLMETGEYRDANGELTAHRTPGFPVFLAITSVFGQGILFPILLIVIASVAVFPIYGTCRKFAPPLPSMLAAGLYVLNPTAIGNAPLILSDTLFMVFTAFTLRFMVEYLFEEKHDPFMLATAVVFAGIGTLIRPLNLLWIFPCIVLIWFVRDGKSIRQKMIYSLAAAALFTAFFLPWVIRNHSIGAGWRLDSSSAVTMTFNAATVESYISGVGVDDVRAKYAQELANERDPEEDTLDDNLTRCEDKMFAVVLEHPVWYVALSLRPWVFLPDIPTLLENQNITQSGQGTFDVLNREGLFAAIKHYFKDRTLALILVSPLIVAALILYVAAFFGLWIRVWRKDWLMMIIFAGFGLAYLLITGPVTMPRYIMPALPVFCIFAAIAFAHKRKKSKPEQSADLPAEQ